MKELGVEKTARLYRKSNWYRVLYVTLENGTEIELNSIIVYDKNGIIVKNEYGYFDNDKTIEIKGEIKRKIKIDFSKTENFVIKSKKRLYRKQIRFIYL